MKISILGYGVFGSAMGSYLEKIGHSVIKEKIEDSELIIVAVPSFAVKDVLISNKEELSNKKIIICSKGFDSSGELLSDVLKREFPNNQIYFLYGPTLADGINSGNLSVMVLAGDKDGELIKKELESENLRIELSDDITGIQVGSALKNTINIFIGLVEGADLGLNTQAFIYAYGLKEMKKIGIYFGANPDTFLDYACAGDLFLQSRSRSLGVELGKGRSFEEVSSELTYPKEGIATLKNVLKIKDDNLDLTFFKLLNSVIFENMSTKEAVKKLSSLI